MTSLRQTPWFIVKIPAALSDLVVPQIIGMQFFGRHLLLMMQWLVDPESSNIFISFVDLQFCIFMGNMIVIGESIFGSIVSIIGVLFST